MRDKQMFFYSLTMPPPVLPIGTSACIGPEVYYFSTQKKLEKFQAKEPRKGEFAMHEISLKCAKELIKLSKKKVKERCYECGK